MGGNSCTVRAPTTQAALFGGSRSRRCPKCPLLVDGTPTLHSGGFQCLAIVLCTVCNSDRHINHSCFIKMGVPKAAKLQAELMVELTRLHTLYVAGKFDWRHTITSLSWINTMRDRLAKSAVS